MKRIYIITLALVICFASAAIAADWNKPALTDSYSNFLSYLNAKILDAGRWFDSSLTASTNTPSKSKRWNATLGTFETYSGAQWRNMTNIYTTPGTGNVGIGTSNSGTKFAVKDQTPFQGYNSDYSAGSAGSGFFFQMGAATGSTYTKLQAYVLGNSSAGNLSINSDGGNVGIGTVSPTTKFVVKSQTPLQGYNTDYVQGSAGSGFFFQLGAATGDTYTKLQAFTQGNSSTGILSLNSDGGNVGIGTATPSTKLEVNGTVTATSFAGTSTNSDKLDNAHWVNVVDSSVAVNSGTFSTVNLRTGGAHRFYRYSVYTGCGYVSHADSAASVASSWAYIAQAATSGSSDNLVIYNSDGGPCTYYYKVDAWE